MQPKKVPPPRPSPRRARRRRRGAARTRPGRGPTRLGGTSAQLADEREIRWFLRSTAGASELATRRARTRAARVEAVFGSLPEAVRATLAAAFGRTTPAVRPGWGLQSALGAAWPAVGVSEAVAAVGGLGALEALYEVARRKAIGAGSKALRMAAFLVVRTSIVLEVRAALKAYRRAIVGRGRRRGGGER